MDDKRKEKLRRLDTRRIQSDGTYLLVDRDGNIVSMVRLTTEDIKYLRWYHRDPNLAHKVVISTNGKSSVPSTKQPSANVRTQPVENRQFKVTRDQKYNKPGYRFKNPVEVIGGFILIFGIVVAIVFSSFGKKPVPKPDSGGSYISSGDYTGETTPGYMDSPTIAYDEEENDYVKQVERAEFIRILCQIFQVDYQTTYSKLVEMTDDFSDSEYLAGRHPLVSCKGMQIDAESEEEFLVYAVRVIAQDPGRVDLEKDDVRIDDGYVSGDNYNEIIAKWAGILRVDPALVYGIIQAETGWNSTLFIEDNNPAGLKDGGKFWVFKNKEAGIIELMLEIVKYQYKGANTIEEIAAIHCPLDDPEDVNGLNQYWIGNVRKGYEQGKEIFEAMGFYKNNGLSH